MHFFIDLRAGGATWEGWYFGPFGRARDWRLHAPTGEDFQAAEIAELRRHVHEIDYLRQRVTELQRQIDAAACYFSLEQLQAIRAAMQILNAALPSERWTGFRSARALAIEPAKEQRGQHRRGGANQYLANGGVHGATPQRSVYCERGGGSAGAREPKMPPRKSVAGHANDASQ